MDLVLVVCLCCNELCGRIYSVMRATPLAKVREKLMHIFLDIIMDYKYYFPQESTCLSLFGLLQQIVID